MTKPHDPLTYRHPRTLKQAFGPGTPPRVEDPPPPGMDWQDVVVITGCLAVMIAVLTLAFVP